MHSSIAFSVLVAIILAFANGHSSESSIIYGGLLSDGLDPFRDPYVQSITRLSIKEMLELPQLSDDEFLNQLNLGIDTVPEHLFRAASNNLSDADFNDQLIYRADIETEWEDMMASGPASINFLGAVMAIASTKDFNLNSDFNYTFVLHPDSFHTTLVQIGNEMHNVLSNAHDSMMKIYKNMEKIPNLVKTALKLITQGSIVMSKALLPRTIANIGQYINESVTITQSTSDRFQSLQYLLQEVVTASTYTTKENKDLADKLKAEALELERNRTQVLEIVAQVTSEYDIAQENLEKAREEYRKAMLNVPGGEWDSAAWEVYKASRPEKSCTEVQCVRTCRDLRDEQFQEYSAATKWKAEEALKLLQDAEKRSRDLFESQQNKQNEMVAAVNQLASLNLAEMSINETIRVLLSASEKISELQKQWSRLARFFSALAIQTENTQKVILKSFLGVIADAEQLGEQMDAMDKVLYMTMLVEVATDIDRDSHLLYLMAKTYSDVSSLHMVDQIAGLTVLVTLQTSEQRDQYVQYIANKTRTASSEVKKLANERQQKYEEINSNRQLQYKEFIQEAEVHQVVDNLGGIGIGKR